MHTAHNAITLSHARQHLMQFGDIPTQGLDERLARSWKRSLTAGLAPAEKVHPDEHRSSFLLRQAMLRNHALLSHSRPVMEYLFAQVHHNQNVVVLADNRGVLMHTLGDPVFLDKTQRVALACGASWHEEHRGTNAIGTAIAESCAIEIHGSEHFLERNGFLTCAAAPIMSFNGELLGILDITGDQHNGHPHTLGLVNTAARMIENRLLLSNSQGHILLHLHAQSEGIGTVAEAIVALTEEGWIVGANRIGMALLGLIPKALGVTQIGSLLDMQWHDFLYRAKRQSQAAFPIRSHNGKLLFAQIQGQTNPSHAPTASKRVQGESQQDALAALDTGDLRWRSAADKARRVLDKPIPILIQGESGVGKEYFARALHESSLRHNGPFVAINCAAIPEHLIEAELFGYEAGAFTGAKKQGSLGRLREASGGTLFLDEIGDMPLGMQTRLLRVLQERTVTPLGAGRSVAVDFALVCATHSHLREEADQGRFRSDLYYRINGLMVQLPSLRERQDFQALAERLLRTLNPERDIDLDAEVLDSMRLYAWPGNLRQFSSVLRTASAMLNPDENTIGWNHLPDDIALDIRNNEAPSLIANSPRPSSEPQNLKDLSRCAIESAMASSQGNVSMAARALGISRQTLYRKLNA
ncbi:MAG: sigma-54-dependent Fis family transcriptional regulator [Sulfuritalea sp.]|nr:sigma-54-dependent Fis family transcriptional regulator [Sulfuritalea sp.]